MHHSFNYQREELWSMKYWSLNKNLILIFSILALMSCSGDSGFVDFQLNLNTPEVQGRQVTVNGGVMAQVERIQWEWGDGQIDRHHFFPASHSYAAPGTYEIKVTVFDNRNRHATRSVSVEIK